MIPELFFWGGAQISIILKTLIITIINMFNNLSECDLYFKIINRISHYGGGYKSLIPLPSIHHGFSVEKVKIGSSAQTLKILF